MATENVKVLKIDTNPATTSVKELRKELKTLKDTMLSVEEGTQEYNDALQKAAGIQHQLKEQMEEVNASAMDFGQIAGNVVKATGSIVAGFQAAKATMNLFGIENEEVLKSLEKMQSLMAITQAIPAIDEGVKAFKRLGLAIKGASAGMSTLKKALISTGIGAAVVALGALAANWDKVTTAVKKFVGASDDSITNLVAQNNKIKEQTKRINELRAEIAKANNEYDEFVTKEKYDKLNTDAKKQYDALTKDIERNQKVLNGIILAKEKAEAKGDTKEFIRQQELQSAFEVTEMRLNKQRDAILANADSYKELDKSIDKPLEKIKKSEKELAVLLWDATQKLLPQSLQDELLAKFGNDGIVLPVKLEIDEEEELSIDDENFLAKADELRKNVESVVSGLRSAFKTPEEQYIEEQNALDLALKTKLISQEEYNTLSERLTKEHNDKQRELAVQEAQIWMSALGNIGTIFSSMGDMIDRSTEEGEEKYKALMYTSTVVSMLAGIGGAIASAFMPVNAGMTIWGQIAMAASTSASVLASGIAQLIQIKNANENSTLGGAGTSVSTPNASSVTNLIAPVQYTQDVQGSSIEGAIKDSKVYVTETDITNTQKKVDVSEQEARY